MKIEDFRLKPGALPFTANQKSEISNHKKSSIENLQSSIHLVAERHYAEYFGYAKWFYKGTDFPALQCVWPDKAGLYPWHEDFNPEWRSMQPLLGTGDETE